MNAPDPAAPRIDLARARRERWTLLDVVDACNCAVYGVEAGDAELAAIDVHGAAISTRPGGAVDAVEHGGIFVALAGPSSHGLQHAAAAFEAGACAVLCGNDPEVDDERWEGLLAAAAERGPVLLATDCDGVTALGRLARAWRRRAGFQVVGISGSSGKTGTKELLRAMLETLGLHVVASRANHNNEIGVPLTLLEAPRSCDVVVCEMGMRGARQLEYLCDIADPDVGVVTNAGTAHLELLGTTEAIVAAKAELLAGTWSGGTAVFPADQAEIAEAADRLPDRALPFAGAGADESEAAVRVVEVHRTREGIEGVLDVVGTRRQFALPLHGVHHARNLAAATCATIALVASVDALVPETFRAGAPADGRGERHPLPGDGVLVDDAYNANPESMRAALDELAAISVPGHRVAVLGHMAELGPGSADLHREVAEHAAGLAIDRLVVVRTDAVADGYLAGWTPARGHDDAPVFATTDEALAHAHDWLAPGDAVLVKASNGAGLHGLAAELRERGSRATT